MAFSIALVGDFNDQVVVAHKAIPQALALATSALGARVIWKWLDTKTIPEDPANMLNEYAAVWVVPGSPYENMAGVLDVIRYARETGMPFLGTCGGFQHALIEYARNVCGIHEADHAETNSDTSAAIVTPLSCSLIGTKGQIQFTPGSILHSIFQEGSELEEYHCNYGLNSKWRGRLENAGIQFTGFDISGDVRAFELPSHPFFVGALFQPERAALQGKNHPLIIAFVRAGNTHMRSF